MNSWGCKFIYKIVPNLNVIKAIFVNFFAMVGFVATLCEFETKLLTTNILIAIIQESIGVALAIVVLISVVKNLKPLSYSYKVMGTDIEIRLKLDDILNSSDAIIIPTCTTFDTIMEDEFISANSIQGKFQNKYFFNNLNELNLKIENSLNKYYPNVAVGYKGKFVGKDKRYPIGTVCKITHSNKHYYLLAIADVNKCGKTINTSFNNITASLTGLWNYMADNGHIENISIPLIGTGRAGIKGVTREKVIKEIIVSFIAFNQNNKITEKLVIYIHPCDLFDKDLDIESIKEFLYYKAKYGYSDTDVAKLGKEII